MDKAIIEQEGIGERNYRVRYTERCHWITSDRMYEKDAERMARILMPDHTNVEVFKDEQEGE